MRFLEVEQIGSPIRRTEAQRSTLVGLGLNKIGRAKWLPDTPETRGMLKKVAHLVAIRHDPAAPKAPPAVVVYDEAADAALLIRLLFSPRNITAEPYTVGENNQGKKPDYKLKIGDKLCGFCELKSPKDDYILENPAPGDLAIRKNLPYYRKLAGHVRKASKQFHAVNADRAMPNILAFVCHAPDIERKDLRAAIAGLPTKGGRNVFLLSKKVQVETWEAARKIDLFIWIDARTGKLQHLRVNGSPHSKAIAELLGLEVEDDSKKSE